MMDFALRYQLSVRYVRFHPGVSSCAELVPRSELTPGTALRTVGSGISILKCNLKK